MSSYFLSVIVFIIQQSLRKGSVEELCLFFFFSKKKSSLNQPVGGVSIIAVNTAHPQWMYGSVSGGRWRGGKYNSVRCVVEFLSFVKIFFNFSRQIL